jgi:cell division protein FtsI (penicillin-binding protein 3)
VRADQNLFKNHAAMDQIEPGSVIKPFVVAAALQEGLVTPDTMVDCELGSWFIGGRTIRDDHPKGVISVTDVIKYSSNIGTAKIGFQLGAGPLLQYLRDFGFARSSGLGLPGEVAGSLRTAANIRTIELATTAFGQGMTSSPVQLASAVATIANDGVRMAPYLVDAVLEGPDATPIVREPRVDRRVVDAEVARAVSRMMETVIEEGGTGTRARVPGYRVAGKTGTAQKVEGGVYSPTKRIGSFVGYIPADRPEIAVAVSIDTPTVGSKYGGIVAAPVFAEVGAFAMRYLGIEADPPTVSVLDPADPTKKIQVPAPPPVVRPYVPPAPLTLAATADGRWVLPDLTGRSLRDALGSLEPAGVALRVDGYGRVTEQSPPAGAIVAPGEPVRIVLN